MLRHDIKILKDPNKEHPDKIFPTSNPRVKNILNELNDCSIRFYIVIDYEATCCKFQRQNFKHEIIEFPAILVDAEKKVIVSELNKSLKNLNFTWIFFVNLTFQKSFQIKEFHSFVKPVLNKKLTDFCTELTGIDQVYYFF